MASAEAIARRAQFVKQLRANQGRFGDWMKARNLAQYGTEAAPDATTTSDVQRAALADAMKRPGPIQWPPPPGQTTGQGHATYRRVPGGATATAAGPGVTTVAPPVAPPVAGAAPATNVAPPVGPPPATTAPVLPPQAADQARERVGIRYAHPSAPVQPQPLAPPPPAPPVVIPAPIAPVRNFPTSTVAPTVAAPQSAFLRAISQYTDGMINQGGMVDTSSWTPDDFRAAAAATGNYFNSMVVGPPGSASANAWAASQVYQARNPVDQAAQARQAAENSALRSAQTASMGMLVAGPGSTPVSNPAETAARFAQSGYTGAQALADGWLTGTGRSGWQDLPGWTNPLDEQGRMGAPYVNQGAAHTDADPYHPAGYTPGVAASPPQMTSAPPAAPPPAAKPDAVLADAITSAKLAGTIKQAPGPGTTKTVVTTGYHAPVAPKQPATPPPAAPPPPTQTQPPPPPPPVTPPAAKTKTTSGFKVGS